MALINHRSREVHFKIVYYGPSLGGKTTNLQALHRRLPQERRGRLLSISTDQERTLFFDFLPVELGRVSGLSTRFHLYTVPGQIYYRLSRRAVLQGLDAVVFVADSHEAREPANRASLVDLWEHLATLGYGETQIAELPVVFQYNKRDLHHALPVERMRAVLNARGWPEFEAVACEGRGVSETLRAACKAVLARMVHTNGVPLAAPRPIVPAATAQAPTAPALEPRTQPESRAPSLAPHRAPVGSRGPAVGPPASARREPSNPGRPASFGRRRSPVRERPLPADAARRSPETPRAVTRDRSGRVIPPPRRPRNP